MSDSAGLILVVDDNEMNRDMLSRRLERQKYETMLAENGERAIEMMREHEFDLVMLDIMMPLMNGYEVLETVKADPILRHVPIIMISAVDDLDSVVRCIEMGAEDYLFKPFNPVLLKARVSAVIEKQRLLRSSGEFDYASLTSLVQVIHSDASGLMQTGVEGIQAETTRRIIDNSEKALNILGQH